MRSISDFIVDLGSGRGNLTIDTGIYNIEAVHAAAYQFTGVYHILTAANGNNSATVIFEAKESGRDITKDIQEFTAALIDHQVRYQLDKMNGKIREAIVARAFAPFDPDNKTDPL